MCSAIACASRMRCDAMRRASIRIRKNASSPLWNCSMAVRSRVLLLSALSVGSAKPCGLQENCRSRLQSLLQVTGVLLWSHWPYFRLGAGRWPVLREEVWGIPCTVWALVVVRCLQSRILNPKSSKAGQQSGAVGGRSRRSRQTRFGASLLIPSQDCEGKEKRTNR